MNRKEYMKKWQQENKEKTRENAKRYYYKNIDKIKEKRQSNEYKEKYREYKREWARNNRKTQKEIINNLQSKIDKAIEIDKTARKYFNKQIPRNIREQGFLNEIYSYLCDIEDILKEDK